MIEQVYGRTDGLRQRLAVSPTNPEIARAAAVTVAHNSRGREEMETFLDMLGLR